MYSETTEHTVNRIKEIGSDVKTVEDADVLLKNKELRLSLTLVRCQTSGDGRCSWWVHFDLERFAADPSLVMHLDLSCLATCENITIDYAVLEKLGNIVVVQLLAH